MRPMSSTHAKQNFGELLEEVARGPVAIERHGKIKAIVCSPEAFQDRSGQEGRLAERRAARADQALRDRDRQIKHQQLAIDLLLMPGAQSEALIAQARREVERWRRDRLCSLDYVERWEQLLGLPLPELARAMGSDALDGGTALRQNSPWLLVSS